MSTRSDPTAPRWELRHGDSLHLLRDLDAASVDAGQASLFAPEASR